MAAAVAAVAMLAAHYATQRATTAIASAERVKAAKAAAAQELADSHAYMRNRLSFPSGERATIGITFAEAAIRMIEKSVTNKSRIGMLTCVYKLTCTYIRSEIGDGRKMTRAKGSAWRRSETGKQYRFLPDRFPDMNEWVTHADGSGQQQDNIGMMNFLRAPSKLESSRPCVAEAKEFISLLDEIERDLITLRSLQHTLARMRGMHPPPHVPIHHYITLSATRADNVHADCHTTEYHLEASTIHIYTGNDPLNVDYWRHRTELQRPPLATVRPTGSKRTLMMTSLLSIVAPVESKAPELIAASGMITAMIWIVAAVTTLLLLTLLYYCWHSSTDPFSYLFDKERWQYETTALTDTQAMIQMTQNMAQLERQMAAQAARPRERGLTEEEMAALFELADAEKRRLADKADLPDLIDGPTRQVKQYRRRMRANTPAGPRLSPSCSLCSATSKHRWSTLPPRVLSPRAQSRRSGSAWPRQSCW
jgi:hypothetical protein